MPLDAAVGDERHAGLAGAPAGIRRSACSCGTPKLVVSRVVQPPPGPMPTLTALTPRSARNRTPSAVATLPATSSTSRKRLLERLDRPRHHDRVAVRDVDHDHVDPRLDELGGALEVSRRSRRSRRRPSAGRARRGSRTAAAPGGECPWP